MTLALALECNYQTMCDVRAASECSLCCFVGVGSAVLTEIKKMPLLLRAADLAE